MPGKKTHVEWMVSEDRFLRLHYATDMPREVICANLPRHTWSAIRCRAAKKLGQMRPARIGEHRPSPTWDQMKALLQTEKLTVIQLVERLQVTQQRVAELIGLHKKEIYVFDRLPTPKRGGHQTPVYAYGNEPDAPMPLSIRKGRVEKNRNPFAAAAGLVTIPEGQRGRIFQQSMSIKDDEMEAA